MQTFQVAHLDIHDVQLVVVFLSSEFDSKSEQQRLTFHAALERCAAREALEGDVVVMWQDPFHRMRFIAPPQQHPFLQIMKYEQLLAQVNRTLKCELPA